MNRPAWLFAALVIVIGGIVLRWGPSEAATAPGTLAEELGERIFEMRTYTTNPGKLEHLHERFRDHTNYLFVKHGMTLIGYWTPVKEEDTLTYILAYPSREAREKSWNAFLDDPEWQRVYKESHKAAGGKIVSKVESSFLKPTDYSPIR